MEIFVALHQDVKMMITLAEFSKIQSLLNAKSEFNCNIYGHNEFSYRLGWRHLPY